MAIDPGGDTQMYQSCKVKSRISVDMLTTDRFEISMVLHRVTSRISTRNGGHKRPRRAGYARRRPVARMRTSLKLYYLGTRTSHLNATMLGNYSATKS